MTTFREAVLQLAISGRTSAVAKPQPTLNPFIVWSAASAGSIEIARHAAVSLPNIVQHIRQLEAGNRKLLARDAALTIQVGLIDVDDFLPGAGAGVDLRLARLERNLERIIDLRARKLLRMPGEIGCRI